MGWRRGIRRGRGRCLSRLGRESPSELSDHSEAALIIPFFLFVTLFRWTLAFRLWFPLLRPDLITHLIETLLDLSEEEAIPFVFALASPVATIDDALRERVKASGRGMLPSFAPQYEILIHPATGWFLVSSAQQLLASFTVPTSLCVPVLTEMPSSLCRLTEAATPLPKPSSVASP